MFQNNFGWGYSLFGAAAQYGWNQPSNNYSNNTSNYSGYGIQQGSTAFGTSAYTIQNAPLPPRYPSYISRPVSYYPDPVWINGIAAGGVPSAYQIPVYQPQQTMPTPPPVKPLNICYLTQVSNWYCPAPIGQNPLRGRVAALGDPYFSLETKGLGSIPPVFKDVSIDLASGKTTTLLSDPDCGGLEVIARGALKNPKGTSTETSIDQLSLNLGKGSKQQQLVFRAADKSLLLNGKVIANLDDNATTGPKCLPGGLGYYGTIETRDCEGNAERQFVLLTPQYRIAASVSEPGQNQSNYLNIVVDEMQANSANNATGDKQIFTGVKNPTTNENAKVSLADLLAIEADNPLFQWSKYR
ncbi:MAG: hypothetical protein VKK59_04620 [Vampirovibrionales bacterium]|nr:hypothetical protein [Vampirovibrionales bacterium]